MQKKKNKKYFLAAAIIFLIAFILFALNIFSTVQALFQPYSASYSDSIPYFMSMQGLYKSFNTYPYLVTCYPPLFYLLFDAFQPLFSTAQPYFYFRFLSLAAAAVDAVLLYFLCRVTFSRSRFGAVLVILLFFGTFAITVTGDGQNIPLFELAFDLLAVILLFSRLRFSYIFAALSLAVAFLFRQSAILIVPGILIYLLLNNERRRGAAFLAVFSVLALIPIVLLNAITNGRYVFSVFILPLTTPFYLSQFTTFAGQLLLYTPFLALLLIYLYYQRSGKKSPLFWIALFPIISVLSAGKWGSSSDYFLVPFTFLCITSVPFLESLLANMVFSGRRKTSSYLLLSVLVLAFALPVVFQVFQPPLFNNDGTAVGLTLKNFSGMILTEAPGVSLAANKSLAFEPSVFWVMQQDGVWNDSQIIADINSQKFSAIATTQGYSVFSLYPGLTNAINESYTLDYTIDGWNILVPRNLTG